MMRKVDQIYKLCSVLGSPTMSSWPEGIKLASKMNFRYPHFSSTPLSKIIYNASAEAIDLITSLCQWDPKKRPTAMQCLQHPYFQSIMHPSTLNSSSSSKKDYKSARHVKRSKSSILL